MIWQNILWFLNLLNSHIMIHVILVTTFSIQNVPRFSHPQPICLYPQFSLFVFPAWCYLFKTELIQRLDIRRQMTGINLTCYDGVWKNSPSCLLRLRNWASSDLSTDIAADRQWVRWLHKVFHGLHDGLFSISSAALRPGFCVCWPKRKAHEGQGCLSTFSQL